MSKHDWPALWAKAQQFLESSENLSSVTWVSLAKHLKVNRSTLTDSLRREEAFRDCATPEELATVLAGTSLAEIIAQENDTYRLQVAHWKALATSLQHQLENRQWFAQMVQQAASVLPPVKPFKYTHLGRRKNEQIAMLVIGDVQRGYNLDPAAVLPGYVPDDHTEIIRYNSEVADRRLKEVFRIWLDIVEDVRAASPVYEGIVACVGDMVDHSGLRPGHERWLDDPNVISQTLGCYQCLLECLQTAAGRFRTLRFVGVPGNHARVIPKHGISQATENFDYLMYRLLEASFLQSPHVTFEIPGSWYHVFDIFDGFWKVLLFHGDEIRNYLGFPWYGAERAARGYQGMMWWITKQRVMGLKPGEPVAREEFVKILAMFDIAVFGHFHTEASWVSAAVEKMAVGSLLAASSFGARKFHEINTPSQLCAFIHPEHGLRAKSTIRLR